MNPIIRTITSSAAVLLFASCLFAEDRALIVGIENYENGTLCNKTNRNEGCVPPTPGGSADAAEMAKLAVNRFGFAPRSIKTLVNSQATTQAIRREFKEWLIEGTAPGDRVFFFYSGHGARTEDEDGDEEDKKDEVLAPYDVRTFPTAANFIVDDEINVWVASLANRHVVMIFDSCYSGAVSGSAGDAPGFSKCLILESGAPTRDISGSAISPPAGMMKNRHKALVIDKHMTGYVGNVVVISAAQAYQEATWIDIRQTDCGAKPGRPEWRGALSYAFEKTVAGPALKLSDLKGALINQMGLLAKQGLFCKSDKTAYQTPEIECNAFAGSLSLWTAGNLLPAINRPESEPGWENSPIAALHNPFSKIKVGLAIKSHNNAYRIGEKINYFSYDQRADLRLADLRNAGDH